MKTGIAPELLARLRDGGYFTRLEASSHARPVLPAGAWASGDDMLDNLDAHHASAPIGGREAAVVLRAQPGHVGSVMGGVRSGQ